MNIAVHAIAANRRTAKKLAAKLHEGVRGQRWETLVAYPQGNDYIIVKATNNSWWAGLEGPTTVAPIRMHGHRQPKIWWWHGVEVV